jgi:hypothetical protein
MSRDDWRLARVRFLPKDLLEQCTEHIISVCDSQSSPRGIYNGATPTFDQVASSGRTVADIAATRCQWMAGIPSLYFDPQQVYGVASLTALSAFIATETEVGLSKGQGAYRDAMSKPF